MTNRFFYDIITVVPEKSGAMHGGIAQLARALGSYPTGRWFKSDFRYHAGPLVKRLRHGPFTAVTWVRFPYGSPKKADTPLSICFLSFGDSVRSSNLSPKRMRFGSGSHSPLEDLKARFQGAECANSRLCRDTRTEKHPSRMLSFFDIEAKFAPVNVGKSKIYLTKKYCLL